jgi:thiamine transporter
MSTRDFTEMAIMIALTAVLEIIFTNANIALFPNGGSISISMLPIVILTLRRGFKVGLVAGAVFGIFQFILPLSVYYLTPVQYAFDYVIPYIALSAIAVVKEMNIKGITVGIVLVGLLKYVSHVIAGIAFWGEYAPEGFNAVSWSLYYNATYSVPSIIITAIVLVVMVARYPRLLEA